MSPHRIRAVARRIAAQFRRDHRSLGLLVGAPILILSLVGALWGGDSERVTRVTFMIRDGVTAELAQQAADRVAQTSDLETSIATRDDAIRDLREGSTDAVIDLSRLPLTITVEGSDAIDTPATLQALQTALLQQGSPGPPSAVGGRPVIEYLYAGADYSLLDYLAPMLVGLFAFFFTFLLSAVSFLRERTSGTLERLMASPLKRAELVMGYLVGFSFFALVQAVVILAFTVYVLNVRYTGNLATIFLITAMLVVVSVSLGLFVSAFARNELQAVQFIPIVLVPQIFLSGLLVPVDQLPGVLSAIAQILPLTYANEALRAVMIKGYGLADPLILRDLGVIAAFALVTAGGAVLSIRRQVA